MINIKATKRRVTIACKPAEAYMIERALAAYSGAMVDVSTKLAGELSDMAYELQRAMIEKNLTTESDKEIYSKAMERAGTNA